MTPDTERAIEALNDAFYQAVADDFSATRARPWPGWERIVAKLGRSPSVLDVGCGNGRFADYLGQSVDDFRYLGVDKSRELIAHARERLASHVYSDLKVADVLREDGRAVVGEGRFDLVVLFAVLHHIPGRDNRLDLMRWLGRCVAPDGLCAFTVWRLDEVDEIRDNIVPWDTIERDLGIRLDPGDLEAEDVVLPWKHRTDVYRYFRVIRDRELSEIERVTGLEVIDRWRSDGRTGDMNQYVLLRRCRPSSPSSAR